MFDDGCILISGAAAADVEATEATAAIDDMDSQPAAAAAAAEDIDVDSFGGMLIRADVGSDERRLTIAGGGGDRGDRKSLLRL